jgi:8-oxo-dGTP pyrophosphatase MutT (NUDIX family)
MAHPHPTPDIPGHWPHLLDEVLACADSDEVSAELCRGLGREDAPGVASGHVCATTWILDPHGEFTLLVRHRSFRWSAPGGHVERHETSRIGGLRELEEETGLTRFDVHSVLDHPALVHTSDLAGDRPHRHWNIAWLYTASMDTPISPVEGARWWPIENLPDGPPGLDATMRRMVALLHLHAPT